VRELGNAIVDERPERVNDFETVAVRV
jgi:hypothetical protein